MEFFFAYSINFKNFREGKSSTEALSRSHLIEFPKIINWVAQVMISIVYFVLVFGGKEMLEIFHLLGYQ